MKIKYLFIILSGLFAAASCSREEKKQTMPRLILNCDGTDLLSNWMFAYRPLSVADVNSYVDTYAQTPITTFMICSGAHNLYYRSAYTRVVGESTDEQVPGTYQNPENVEIYYRNFLNVEREGADVITTVLQRAKERHLETFISYRMNDLHFNEPEAPLQMVSDFWKNHPEYWIGEDYGWHTFGAFDFAHPEVRAFKTGIITEQLDKYGHLIDGFDLDFMRMPAYFKKSDGAKNAPLMTELLQAVRQKIDATSNRIGRNILLSVRVWADVEQNLQSGIDVKEWVRLGLPDMISVGVYWRGHPALPVAKFRQYLGNGQVPLCATVDDGGYRPREIWTHGQRRGMAAHAYAQGAAGLYLFNHSFIEDDKVEAPAGSRSLRTIKPVLYELGSPEMLRKRNKIFALDDGGASAFGFVSDTPLPLTVTAANRSSAELYVADNVQEDKPQEAILFLRTDRPESLLVRVNETNVDEQQPEYVAAFDRGGSLSGTETVYAFRVPLSALRQGANQVAIASSGGDVEIRRIEIALKYGDVETYGYF